MQCAYCANRIWNFSSHNFPHRRAESWSSWCCAFFKWFSKIYNFHLEWKQFSCYSGLSIRMRKESFHISLIIKKSLYGSTIWWMCFHTNNYGTFCSTQQPTKKTFSLKETSFMCMKHIARFTQPWWASRKWKSFISSLLFLEAKKKEKFFFIETREK